MMARLQWDLGPPSTTNVVKVRSLLDPRMNYVRRQFNFNRAGSHALHACTDPEHLAEGLVREDRNAD